MNFQGAMYPVPRKTRAHHLHDGSKEESPQWHGWFQAATNKLSGLMSSSKMLLPLRTHPPQQEKHLSDSPIHKNAPKRPTKTVKKTHRATPHRCYAFFEFTFLSLGLGRPLWPQKTTKRGFAAHGIYTRHTCSTSLRIIHK